MAEKSDWQAVVSAFLLGVVGAIQVGRVAPVATSIQADLQIDLATLGWLISLITLASAGLGIVAGYWVVHFGLRRSLVIGALMIGVCACLAGLLPTVPLLMGARIIEGFGYLIVVVAAPTLIAREAAPKDTPFALAFWGTFFTLGLSVAAFSGGALSDVIGWRGWFLVSAGLVAAAVVLALVSVSKDQDEDLPSSAVWETVREVPKASWLLGSAFLGLTLLALSILSLLPTFLVQEHGLTPRTAGSVTGFVALASIVGSLCYGAFANRMSESVVAAVASIALVLCIFLAFAEVATTYQIVAFAGVAVLMSGILVAQTFAAVPRVASDAHLIGPTNGLVAQFGSVGALTGPPLIGASISLAGWGAVPIIVAAFTLSFAGLFLLAIKDQGNRLARGGM
ncbi:MAG: MFS transporter [Pseudomonadota bacterium]